MPIYEYKCESCGTKFEKLVRRNAEAAEFGCPSCGDKRLNQEFSTFASHANGGNGAAAEAASCPSGMCGNPGMCGRN